MKTIVITGGAGFIGSHVVRLFVNKYPEYHIINLDKLTYAGNLANLKDIEQKPNYEFVKMDDVVNLHAGANYRINSTVGVWLQAHNLLNRRYDILFGHGAQRIGFMGGVSLNF